MRICSEHWRMMRGAIELHGLSGLVLKSGEAAIENEMKSLEGGCPDFDPLMSMHWHYTNIALECGGLYLMTKKEDGSEYCPVCEMAANMKDFVPKDSFEEVAKQMRSYAIEEGLLEIPS